MDKVTSIIRSRKKRRAKDHKNPAGRVGLASATVLSLLVSLFVIGAAFLVPQIVRDLPSPAELTNLLSPPNGELLEPTRLYDRTGNEILWSFENLLIKEREYVSLEALSETKIGAATVAAADTLFWSRTNWQLLDWRSGDEASIPRRLVSDLLFWGEQEGLQRQLRERLLAAQIVAQFGREQILEWYLNNAYYGHQIYGLESAARVYFGKSAPDLNLNETALLAAVGEAPALNPFDAPQAARERQEELLHAMLKAGAVTAEEVRQAAETELIFQEPPPIPNIPAFVEYILQQASSEIPEERLKRGGFKIITTLEADLQSQAACAIQHQLLRAAGSADQPDPACQTARLLPSLPEQALFDEERLAANVIILDPQNGQLLAMIGDSPQDRDSALGEAHPTGSILTPFLYLTAFTRGDDPSTLVWDIPLPTTSLTVEETHPNCKENCQYQGPVRLRIALANDYLSPALVYWEKLGRPNIANIILKLGVTLPETCPDCEHWDGEVGTLLDIAQAYATFSNQGILMGWPSSANEGSNLPPVSVLRIEDVSGKFWLAEPEMGQRPVISPQLAYTITHILADETARWPSLGHPNVLEIGRPVGVKIGHTAERDSAWTVGYTPQRVAAVWVGLAEGEDNDLLSGEDIPGPKTTLPEKVATGLWRAITQYAVRDLLPLGWEAPTGITTLDVCDPSGMLPTEYCPAIVSEVFISGSEPMQLDNLYQVREVNRETGRLATVFTPPELIEEHVYLIVPPNADEWAATQGMSTPPEVYDVAYKPSFSESLSISEPKHFSYVRGEVPIWGTASGSDFVSYQIRLGKGLNPQTWQQYGSEVETGVEDALLWEWDTIEFEDGLYAIRLAALYEGQRLEKATILVSVDNTPPDLVLSKIEDEQVFKFQSGGTLTFQAQASDNVELDAVTFTLNGETIASRIDPPFVYAWKMKLGTYTLLVSARDMAGNVTEREVTFSVER